MNFNNFILEQQFDKRNLLTLQSSQFKMSKVEKWMRKADLLGPFKKYSEFLEQAFSNMR